MIDLEKLMKMHDAATPGPWAMVDARAFLDDEDFEIRNGQHCIGYGTSEADAQYGVAACNAVPELVERIRELEAEIKRRDAYKLAEICNACTDDRFCPYIGPCPFCNKKRGEITPEDWIKRLEGKK